MGYLQEPIATILNILGEVRMYVHKLLEMHILLSKAELAEGGEISCDRKYIAMISVSQLTWEVKYWSYIGILGSSTLSCAAEKWKRDREGSTIKNFNNSD